MASKRSDGRREGKYVFEGARYSIYGTTKKERDEKWEAKKQELEKHRYRADRKLTVSEYFDRWLENRKNIKPSTYRTYGKLKRMVCGVKLYKKQTFGEIKLIKLDPQNCRDLQNKLSDKFSTRTVNDGLSLLKKCLQTAVNEDVIDKNPCRTIERIPRTEPKARDTIHRYISREEYDTFMGKAKDSPYYNLFEFLYYTGLRIGEASALTIADVVGDNVNVSKTVIRAKEGYMVADWTKTEAGCRIIPIHPKAKEAIERQMKINALIDGENVVSMNKPVFRLPKGGIIRPDRVNANIRTICEQAKLEKFTCHAFRATFISNCADSGMPLIDSMTLSGHTDIKTHRGYMHNNAEHTRQRLLAVNF